MPSEPRIFYIAGYSRSGSTVLDMALGTHPEVAATGELTYLLDDAAGATRRCSCGQIYCACPLYGPWLGSPQGRSALAGRGVLRRIESRDMFARLARGQIPAADAARYADHARSLIAHIAGQTGARVILDSSKSARDAAGRPLALARIARLPVRVLHLTRDPRAVIGSYCEKGSNWVIEGHRRARMLDSFRPILGWRAANAHAADLRRELGARDYMHVRYEDLIARPQATLDRIGAFAGLDLTGLATLIRRGARFSAGHNVGGNRARMAPQRIALAEPAPAVLPILHEAAFRLAGRGPARAFGYARGAR